MYPTEWVHEFIRIRNSDTGGVTPIDFSKREYLKTPYNTGARKVLFMMSRQTEKSTTLSNKLIATSAMTPYTPSLFVSPSAMQTMAFSKARIDDTVEDSALLSGLRTDTWKILEKVWSNKSRIYFRYAFANADRVRGLSVKHIYGDEIQDLLPDVMPVIEEAASRFQDSRFVYSGTPKSFSNTIEKYWGEHSTQNEFCFPCKHHGTPNDPSSWHWVVLDIDNIGLKGPICEKCGNYLDLKDPDAQWVTMSPGKEWEGFRVCRLMVPWFQSEEKWKDILLARDRYSEANFMNEVLARSFDSGDKPFSKTIIRNACEPSVPNSLQSLIQASRSIELFMGIDWGEGTRSYVVVSVGGYIHGDQRFQILYSKAFKGQESNPTVYEEKINALITQIKPIHICADWGAGFHINGRMISKWGPERWMPIQYIGVQQGKLKYLPQLHVTRAYRSPIITDYIDAVKRGQVRFPDFESYWSTYGEHHTNLGREVGVRQTKYVKMGGPDDTVHANIYTLLASLKVYPRPDIFGELHLDQEQMDEIEARKLLESMM